MTIIEKVNNGSKNVPYLLRLSDSSRDYVQLQFMPGRPNSITDKAI